VSPNPIPDGRQVFAVTEGPPLTGRATPPARHHHDQGTGSPGGNGKGILRQPAWDGT
jgi:hypothetical protein